MSPQHVEPSECSKVAKMMLAHAFSKELVGDQSSRGLRENVFQELQRSDQVLSSHAGLRSCASNLGQLLIDRPPPGVARPPLPAHLQDAPRDDYDVEALVASAASSRKQQSIVERVATPFEFNKGPVGPASQYLAKPPEPWPDAGRVSGNTQCLRPQCGRSIKVPGPRGASALVPGQAERVVSSRLGSSRGLAVSQSAPALRNATPKNARLVKALAKLKTTKADPAAHLRQCPIQMGYPNQKETTYQKAATGPVEMAMDPKWSTELRKLDVKVGTKLKFETRLSGACVTVCPELRYLPRDYEDGFIRKALPKAL